MSQTIDPAVVEHVTTLAERARVASRRLALMSRAEKDAALLQLADAVDAAAAEVIAANGEDLERGRAKGMSESLQDRLRLDDARVAAVAQALRDVAALPDPVGEIVRGSTLANGLQIRQVRVPMGVIGMIYEARPNVTLDAAQAITLNAKTQRPSVCNAAESLLVHRDVAADFLPKTLTDLAGAGVRLHVAPEVTEYAEAAGAAYALASEADFGTEWHGLEMSVALVDDLDEAMDRIRRYGTGHTEAIITEDRAAARRFTAEVDAAVVMVNA